MSDAIISVRDLQKCYRIYDRPLDRVREKFLRRPLHRQFQALRGVSLDVARGEGFGIVGENGAGKSTLLKILSGVVTPTAGEVAVRGSVASLLELGSAFHPELSGRQNIRLNAAMLGLSPEQIDLKTPEIIAFSELDRFIDQPVKCYSTGMAMRLGFAIATQVEPDVLIIDEALSVGDGYFQKKCMDLLQRYMDGGGTLLFCSHAMYYVTAFCRRAAWLRQGSLEALGPAADVVREYENFLLHKGEPEPGAQDKPGQQPARIREAVLLHGRQDGDLALYRHQEPWELVVEWHCDDPSLQFHLAVGVDRIDGVQIASFSTFHDGLPPMSGRRRYRLHLELPRLPLIKGEFSIYVYLLDERALHPYDQKILRRAFGIEHASYEIGLIRVDHRWVGDQGARLQPAPEVALEASAAGSG